MNLIKSLFRISFIFILFVITAVVITNQFFLDVLLEQSIAKFKQESKLELEYSSLSGNLLTGAFEFNSINLNQTDLDKDNYKLSADSLEIKIPLYNVLTGKIWFSNISVGGLRGYVELVGKVSDKKKHLPLDIVVSNLDIHDAEVLIYNKKISKHEKLHLKVNQLISKNLRLSSLLQDLLFASNIYGELNHKPFYITNAKDKTKWALSSFDVDFLTKYVDKSWSWMLDGFLTLDFTNTAVSGSKDEYNMKMKIVLDNLTAGKNKLPKEFVNTFLTVIDPRLPLIPKNVGATVNIIINKNTFKDFVTLKKSHLFEKVSAQVLKEFTKQALDPKRVNKLDSDDTLQEDIKDSGPIERSLEIINNFLKNK